MFSMSSRESPLAEASATWPITAARAKSEDSGRLEKLPFLSALQTRFRLDGM